MPLSNLVTAFFDGLTPAWTADPDGTKPDAVFKLLEALIVPFYLAAMTSDPPRASRLDPSPGDPERSR
jgi:hypothetical protein